MFQSVSLEEAAARHWDVVVAGTSFASMFFVRALPRDLSVLFVEKGAVQEHADQVERGISGRESIAQENASDHPKRWVAHTKFGGNSNCWWAQTPRFHPSDFRLKSLYGIGEDWPLGYDYLEGDYLEVERVMQVAGGGTEHLIPRSAPYPFPPHPGSLSDRHLRQERPDIWMPAATARSNGSDRAICCNNGVCHLCPIDSKFTVLTASTTSSATTRRCWVKPSFGRSGSRGAPPGARCCAAATAVRRRSAPTSSRLARTRSSIRRS